MRSLLLSLLQKRFLNTSLPPPTAPSSPSFTVQYLITSCGLSLQSARSVSKKFQIDEQNLQKPLSVIQLLKSHDFKDAHIAKMIEKRPRLLHCSTQDNLKPKFDFFIKNGFVGRLLPELLVSDPVILTRNLGSRIKPCFKLLKSFVQNREGVVALLKRAPFFLSYGSMDSMQLNIDLLVKEGVAADRIAKLLIWQPRSILYKPDRIVYALNALKNLGLQPGDKPFVQALSVRIQSNDTAWKKKLEVIKSLGWSEEEVLRSFKRHPPLFGYSEKKIRTAMDFFIDTMKLERQSIINSPNFLGMSIDKRIRPRYNVIKVLESKELIKRDKKISTLLSLSEKNFLAKYVIKYADEVPGLLEIYGGAGKAK